MQIRANIVCLALRGCMVAAVLPGLALVCACVGRPATEDPCPTGFCHALSSGALAGVTRMVSCSETFCPDQRLQCKSTLRVLQGAAPGGDGSSQRPLQSLAQAASKAAAGDCVLVGPGDYSGAVFAGGVRILGAGAARTRVTAASGSPAALTLKGGRGGLVRGLDLGGDAMGLLVDGVETLVVQQLRVSGASRVGLYASRATNLVLEQVTVRETRYVSAGSAGGAGMGLVLAYTPRATLRGCLLQANQQLGLAAYDSLLISNSTAVLQNGDAGIEHSTGAMFWYSSGGDAGSLQQTTISQNQGYGLLIVGAAASLDDCRISDNNGPGVLVQDTAASHPVTLRGSTLSGNRGMGLLASRAGSVTLSGGLVSGTRSKTTIDGVSTVTFGDGVQVSSSSSVNIHSVTFRDSARLHVIYDNSAGSVQGSTFKAGVPALVLQQGAQGQVTLGGNSDLAGAAVSPTIPATPYSVYKR